MTKLGLKQIKADGGTQPRAMISEAVVIDYAEAMRGGGEFPPITVFYDGKHYWLADGFHRHSAAQQAGLDALEADVRQGDRRDAILHSVGANATHGLRRTNDDKRRAVTRLLNDEEWGKWSDSEIARRCQVHHSTVAKYREEISPADLASERTYTTKHGTTATMRTANIGASQPPPPPEPYAPQHSTASTGSATEPDPERPEMATMEATADDPPLTIVDARRPRDSDIETELQVANEWIQVLEDHCQQAYDVLRDGLQGNPRGAIQEALGFLEAVLQEPPK